MESIVVHVDTKTAFPNLLDYKTIHVLESLELFLYSGSQLMRGQSWQRFQQDTRHFKAFEGRV
jgi:hypothetical protein